MAHHGSTPAAWTLVVLMLLGLTIGAIGMVAGIDLMLWIGVALIPISLVVGKIMQKMGLGAEPLHRDAMPSSQH